MTPALKAKLPARVRLLTMLTSDGKKTTAEPIAVDNPDMHTSPKAMGTLSELATMVTTVFITQSQALLS